MSHIFSVGRDVVCSLAVVRALCQPPFDRVAVRWRVVFAPALETEIPEILEIVDNILRIILYENPTYRQNFVVTLSLVRDLIN